MTTYATYDEIRAYPGITAGDMPDPALLQPLMRAQRDIDAASQGFVR